MLDCQMFGLKPWGHHLTSVLLHTVNTALVFLLLCALTGAVWRSLLVAALFGLHPLHVESVAWVAERKDVLSTFLRTARADVLRALRAMSGRSIRVEESNSRKSNSPTVRHSSSRSRSTICVALFFFALGLMSKPMLVTLAVRPAAAGLLAAQANSVHDSAHSGNSGSLPTLLRCGEKLPFFALAVAGERRDLCGAETAEALWRRVKTFRSARAAGTR